MVGVVLVVAVIGLVVAGLSARPVWRAVKRHRAHGFLVESEKGASEAKWNQAFAAARSAEQLAPADATVLRHLARLHARVGSEAGINYYNRLLQLPESSRDDREELAALALAVGNPELASLQLEELAAGPQASARSLLLSAQLATMRRDQTNAIRLAREAVRIEPSNPTNSLTLAGLLVRSSALPDREEGRRVVWPFARTNGALQVAALAVVVDAVDAPRAEREEVEAILRGKSNRTLYEELLWQSARIALDPSQSAKITDEVIERHGRGSVDDVVATAAWLNKMEQFSRTKDLVVTDLARQDARLFNLRYAALTALKDHASAYEMAKDQKAPGDPLRIEMLRCTSALQLKDKALIDAHFHALVDLGKKSGRGLRAVASFALSNGQTEIAAEAFQAMLKSRNDAPMALAGLMRIADAKGETWNARDLGRKLLALRPDQQDVRMQVTYYDLLLKENLDEGLKNALSAHSVKPEDFNRRAVLALAYLRQSEPRKAVDLLDGQMVSWARVPPGLRAVVAQAYHANGRAEGASNLAVRLPLSTLKPEERELVKPILSAGAVSIPDPTPNAARRPEKGVPAKSK